MSRYSIKDLVSLVPVPEDPVGTPQSGWNDLERKLISLPDDYKSFVEHYGSGNLGCITVFSPFTKDMIQAGTWYQETLDSLGDGAVVYGDGHPHGKPLEPVEGFCVFPKKDGALNIALSVMGTDINLMTGESDPNTWKISEVDECLYFEYDCGWIDYIVMSIKGEMKTAFSIGIDQMGYDFTPN